MQSPSLQSIGVPLQEPPEQVSPLVQRVIEGADVEQAIDVLSRPNIGVLEPQVQAGHGVAVQVNVGTQLPGIGQ
mgnify:CR=1 FL=1